MIWSSMNHSLRSNPRGGLDTKPIFSPTAGASCLPPSGDHAEARPKSGTTQDSRRHTNRVSVLMCGMGHEQNIALDSGKRRMLPSMAG